MRDSKNEYNLSDDLARRVKQMTPAELRAFRATLQLTLPKYIAEVARAAKAAPDAKKVNDVR